MLKKLMFATLIGTAFALAPLAQASAQAPAAKTDTKADAKAAKPKKEPSAGQIAARERQKKCGAEWKAAKAAGKTEKGETWPKYWSACNKRLKGAAA